MNPMSIDEYRRLGGKGKGRPKYRNEKVVTTIGTFDSKKECDRFWALQMYEKAGSIKNLRRQVAYEVIHAQYGADGKLLENAVKYIADFVYEQGGETVVEDAKGYRTPEYKIKRKLMLRVHGIRIRET